VTNNNHLYSDFEAKLDTLIGRVTEASVDKYDHWRSLQMAKAEYDNMRIAEGRKFELEGFATWLEDTYGFRIHRPDNMIGQTFEIIDEAKYTFYKLKYA
jgi:hypothetical protein